MKTIDDDRQLYAFGVWAQRCDMLPSCDGTCSSDFSHGHYTWLECASRVFFWWRSFWHMFHATRLSLRNFVRTSVVSWLILL
jgi:hypothetical protein